MTRKINMHKKNHIVFIKKLKVMFGSKSLHFGFRIYMNDSHAK